MFADYYVGAILLAAADVDDRRSCSSSNSIAHLWPRKIVNPN
jgi:hypothetical protein